ncbi:hypothetical protein BJX96DRAFT_180682 [Aspergillus floccosus]
MTAQTDKAAAPNVLWLPYLHRDNGFVDPLNGQITSIVDWQSARVVLHSTRPISRGCSDILDPLFADQKENIDAEIESEKIHKYYQAQVYKRSPRHWAVLQQFLIPLIRRLVWLVNGAWEHRHLFFLQQSLMWIAKYWGEIVPGGVTCPIAFTEAELELHSWEENIDGVGPLW